MYVLLGVEGGWLARGDRCGKGARGFGYCNLHFCRCWCWSFGWIMSTSVARGVLDYVVTGFGYSVIGRGGEGKGWGERIEAKCVG